MKKTSLLTFLIVLLCLTGCSSNKNPLEGYWISDNGNTIAFTSETEVVIDNEIIGEYSIYDDNKLLIKVDALVAEIPLSAEFSVTTTEITLRDLKSNEKYVYYSEEKFEQRKENEEKAYNMFYDEIAPSYSERFGEDTIFYLQYQNIIEIEEQTCYEALLYAYSNSEEIPLNWYAVNPENGLIYIGDYYIHTEDSMHYTLWNK